MRISDWSSDVCSSDLPDRRVLALTGDAELLMGVGSLATIGVRRPKNLAVVVLDNGRFGETGGQVSHTAEGVDIAGIAESCGVPVVCRVSDSAGIADLRERLRSEEHTSELQSLMRISSAAFCLKKKK